MRLTATAPLGGLAVLWLRSSLATVRLGCLGGVLRSQRAVGSGWRLLGRLVRHVVVRHAAAFHIPAASWTSGDGLVAWIVVVGLGVFEDDVPGM